MFKPLLKLPRTRILAAGTVPLHLRQRRRRLRSLLRNPVVTLGEGLLGVVTGEVRICFRTCGSEGFDMVGGAEPAKWGGGCGERARKMNALEFEWKLCGTLKEQGISCTYVEATAEVGFRLR